jgi:hypothetical protein
LDSARVQAAMELLQRLARDTRGQQPSKAWLGQSVETSVLNLVATALLRTGVLDASEVAAATKSVAAIARVSAAGGASERLPVVLPCPARVELSNAVVTLRAIEFGSDSAELVVETSNFRPMPIEPVLEVRELLGKKRTSGNTDRLRRLRHQDRKSRAAYTSVDIDSLRVRDDNGSSYRLEAVAGSEDRRFALKPSPSVAASFLEFCDSAGSLTWVRLHYTALRCQCEILVASSAEALASVFTHLTEEVLAARRIWEPEAFEADGLGANAIPILRKVAAELAALEIEGDFAGIQAGLDAVDTQLQDRTVSEAANRRQRWILEHVRDDSGPVGGVVLDGEFVEIDDLRLAIRALSSSSDHFELWAQVTPLSLVSEEHGALDVPTLDWSAEDGRGGAYIGRVDPDVYENPEEGVRVVFTPPLEPMATALAVTCSLGRTVIRLGIPLRPWLSVESGHRPM